MLNDITLGQFIPGQSAVHRLDARVKILLSIFYITILFVADSFWMYGVFFLYIMAVALISKTPVRVLLKSLKPITFIIVLTFVMNVLLMRQGDVLFSIFGFAIYKQSVIYALRLAVRLILLLFGTSMLTLTTSPISLTDALERLMKPLRVIRFPAHELAMMMTIALRFIPTLLEETDKIMKAQKARCADFDSGGVLKKAKALVPLLVPLFVNAFRRADELAMAMESRCYHGGEGRTRMRVLKLTRLDLYAVLVNVALLAMVIFGG